MHPYDPIAHALSINRRSFLTKSAYGLGSAAFAMLAAKGLAAEGLAAEKAVAGWGAARPLAASIAKAAEPRP